MEKKLFVVINQEAGNVCIVKTFDDYEKALDCVEKLTGERLDIVCQSDEGITQIYETTLNDTTLDLYSSSDKGITQIPLNDSDLDQ